MLALFVSTFNYSPTEFYKLTPYQAFTSLTIKARHDYEQNVFNQYENRKTNFFIAIASGAKYNSPEDLYELDFDDATTETIYTDKQKETLTNITEEDYTIVRKLTKV